MTVNVAGTWPDLEAVGRRAAAILDAVRADEDFDRLACPVSCQAGWSTFIGSPIASWSARDLAIALGLPAVVCVSLFVLVIAAITRD